MKYWNKSKEVRERCWTKVKPPTWRPGEEFKAPYIFKTWCQNQSSNGKFYYYAGSDWWFERPEDASWFLLRWL